MPLRRDTDGVKSSFRHSHRQIGNECDTVEEGRDILGNAGEKRPGYGFRSLHLSHEQELQWR